MENSIQESSGYYVTTVGTPDVVSADAYILEMLSQYSSISQNSHCRIIYILVTDVKQN